MTRKQLCELIAQKTAAARAMIATAETANRDFTKEEEAEYQATKTEIAGLNARLARAEDQENLEASLEAPRPAAAAAGGTPIIRAGGPEAKKEFESLAEFLCAATFNRDDQRLNYVENTSPNKNAEQRMDEGAAGGFAVPTQFLPTLRQIDPQEVIVRPRAEVIPAGTPPDSAVTMVALDQTNGDVDAARMYGGVKVVWTGEGKTVKETDAKLREITLTPQEVSGLVTVTNKLLRNWSASASVIEKLLRGAMSSAEDWSFIMGDGVAKPKGFINSASAYKVARKTANTVAYVDIAEMVARLMGTSGLWLVTKAMLPKLMVMEDSEGHLIWSNAANGNPPTLAGIPVKVNERQPSLGVKGDLCLADLSKYLIKDGSGPFVSASEHAKFEENKTLIKIVWNVDGSSWLTAPLTGEGGYQTSPFVALDVPAG